MTITRALALAACTWATVAPLAAQAPSATPRAWSLLEQGVANGNADTRARALGALGLVAKSERARRLAEAALRDAEPGVRAAAATALGQIGMTEAAPALRAAAGESEAEVVFAAASALLKLGDPTGYRVYYAVLTGQRKTGEPLVESQLKMLKDPNALARIGFEQGIGFIPFGGIGLQAVKAFRQDNVSPVRAAAAQRLAGDPDPASGQALVTATTDDKWLVRASAVSAIAVRGDRSLEPALMATLDDENETVRFTAAAAIARLQVGAAR